MVQKLSGFAKFDLDTKITSHQFFRLLQEFCTVENEVEEEVLNENGDREMRTSLQKTFDADKYNRIMNYFERAFKDGQPPFAGDLENETYKGILAKMKSFTP